MKVSLTKRQKEILDFIREYIHNHEYSPSYEEIRSHEKFGFRSLNSVHEHIKALERKGYVRKIPGVNRGIVLMKQETGAVEIPLLGEIAAGRPIESMDDEVVSFPAQMMRPGKDYYALRVEGNSMAEGGIQGILDGDIILVEQVPAIEYQGQIAVVVNSRYEASLKRVYFDERLRKYKLVSDNLEYRPMYWSPSNTMIQGVFRGLLRDAKEAKSIK